jgi:hypothetical protein
MPPRAHVRPVVPGGGEALRGTSAYELFGGSLRAYPHVTRLPFAPSGSIGMRHETMVDVSIPLDAWPRAGKCRGCAVLWAAIARFLVSSACKLPSLSALLYTDMCRRRVSGTWL